MSCSKSAEILPTEHLIVFTRYPEAGKTKTRLIPLLGRQGAADLHRRMTEHALSRLKKPVQRRPLSLTVMYEGGNQRDMEQWLGHDMSFCPQVGDDLGERMLAAFIRAFDSKAFRTVIVGTDCPGLTDTLVDRAFESLHKSDLVLGPASDGGYYLIGLREPLEPLFRNIPWGSKEVRARTLEVAERLGLSVTMLDLLDDVDRPEDMHIWEKEIGTPSIKGFPENRLQPDPVSFKFKETKQSATAARLSVVIPAINEAATIGASISSAATARNVEIIVVDGGSKDQTLEMAQECGAKTMTAAACRACQMNAGAKAASGEILLFLHGDTQLPQDYEKFILQILGREDRDSASPVVAGAFLLGIDAPSRGLRVIEMMVNWRSRRLQFPYGDQGIFMKSEVFHALGGFKDMPIMEDFELVRRLHRRGRIVIAPAAVRTSARRWQKMGLWRTTLLNQVIIAAYFLGVAPQRLAKWYRQ